MVHPLSVVSLVETAEDRLTVPSVVTVPPLSLLIVAVIDPDTSATNEATLSVAAVSITLLVVVSDGVDPPPSTVFTKSARLELALLLVVADHWVL